MAKSINLQGAFLVQSATQDIDGALHSPEDVRLPHHCTAIDRIALDIGGSLIKVVCYSREVDQEVEGGRLSFFTFETDQIDECLKFVKRRKVEIEIQAGRQTDAVTILATGGGAFKYHAKMNQCLGTKVIQEDEMECLISGLDFFITRIPKEVFTYTAAEPMPFEEPHSDVYPYLLVNIGSGVSMIRVSGPSQYDRVGGTSLGGGTFWGLSSLLTGARTFDEMLSLADRGDNRNVDMLVGDIYGTDYSKIGLSTEIIASSFGKVFKMKRQGEQDAEDGTRLSRTPSGIANEIEKPQQTFSPEDISLSLLTTVSNNIGQIAYLFSEKHNLKNIYFGGSYTRGHRQTMKALSTAIGFWSNGSKKAYFLRHEGYLGSVGTFLKPS